MDSACSQFEIYVAELLWSLIYCCWSNTPTVIWLTKHVLVHWLDPLIKLPLNIMKKFCLRACLSGVDQHRTRKHPPDLCIYLALCQQSENYLMLKLNKVYYNPSYILSIMWKLCFVSCTAVITMLMHFNYCGTENNNDNDNISSYKNQSSSTYN